MKKIKLVISLLFFAAIISCNNNKPENKTTLSAEKGEINYNDVLPGSWVEPNPINKNEVQGIEILKGGEAKSINMATLLYKNWWVENDKLFLVAESIGNHTSSVDTTSYTISNIDSTSLTLTDSSLTIKYKKQ